jgi:hypothetical protein
LSAGSNSIAESSSSERESPPINNEHLTPQRILPQRVNSNVSSSTTPSRPLRRIDSNEEIQLVDTPKKCDVALVEAEDAARASTDSVPALGDALNVAPAIGNGMNVPYLFTLELYGIGECAFEIGHLDYVSMSDTTCGARIIVDDDGTNRTMHRFASTVPQNVYTRILLE